MWLVGHIDFPSLGVSGNWVLLPSVGSIFLSPDGLCSDVWRLDGG